MPPVATLAAPRTTLLLPSDEGLVGSLRDRRGGHREPLNFSVWLESLPTTPNPLPVEEAEPETTAQAQELCETPLEQPEPEPEPETPWEAVHVWDPFQPTSEFLKSLPYGGSSRAPVRVPPPTSLPSQSVRQYLTSAAWNGSQPTPAVSLVDMMARATQDAVTRSRQRPLPAASTSQFLRKLPWNRGMQKS